MANDPFGLFDPSATSLSFDPTGGSSSSSSSPFNLGTLGSLATVIGKGYGTTPAGSNSTNVSGFNDLPQAVKDAWLKQYLPNAIAQTQRPYYAPPMKRAPTTPGLFDSQGLADLQKYSDAAGGLFTRLNQMPSLPPQNGNLAIAAQQAAANAALVNSATNTKPGGANGYDGTQKDGDIRTFTKEEFVPGAPGAGTFVYHTAGGWKPAGTLGF